MSPRRLPRRPPGRSVPPILVGVAALSPCIRWIRRRPTSHRGPSLEVTQRNLQFDPGVLLAPVGSQVAFPNADDTGHHVYSFSPAKIFDLRIIAGGQSDAVLFDQVGSVAIGCNIHDNMVGFIHVVDTPYAAVSDASGLVQIRDVPNGRYRLRFWHQALDARGNVSEIEVTLTDERSVMDYALEMRRTRDRRGRY